MIETIKESDTKKILKQAEKIGWLQEGKYEVVAVSPLFKQQLSHQLIAGQFIKIKLKKVVKNDWLWVSKNQLKKYAFPKFINQYLDNKGMQNLF